MPTKEHMAEVGAWSGHGHAQSLAVEQTLACMNWKVSCVAPCRVSHRQRHQRAELRALLDRDQ